MTISKERIGAAEVARITGLYTRTIQMMAARSEIPSAAKFSDMPGTRWTFDENTIRHWVKQREEAVKCPAIYLNAGTFGGPAPRLPEGTLNDRYERLLGLKRSDA